MEAPAPTPLTPLANSLLFRTESRQSRSSHNATAVAHSSPSRSPRRLNTDPRISSADELRLRVNKRIVVCCDGTWQDGISELHRSRYTNVLRLARTIHHEDERFQPPIPQVVYYQSGIGTEKNFYSEYIEADKVEEAYAFIRTHTDSYIQGAYTARMVAMLIGEFGVLDRKDMDHFAKIFICYQKLGKTNNREDIHEDLESWRRHDASGKTRIDCDGDTFTIKCLGVFDTVGSVGLPETLTLRARSPKARNLLGMKDPILGEHVERAYQALALNEMRRDFRCNKFEQTEQGRLKKQVLEQIGGGYEEHDLADLSLIWMAVCRRLICLGLDVKYLSKLPKPVAPWGKQQPHKSERLLIYYVIYLLTPIRS
ncbi:hypothetical protein DFP72DRAFT_865847 [Ephemerocybe angulata]|uniref:T6SS Phospholipase effector Tle1-like catalytic domain-containing protein n=1 Tax=Ephemerocybe angulata TaxID=980116 RepID=A0A8H6IL69_9AGAR|nr:hypothetical protein DFP72DRAFT_865847 [Tulosesus angulatus]